MLNLREDNNWIVTNNKKLRHPHNKRFVTARVNIINKKTVIRISIGLYVCEMVEFEKNDRVNIFINKSDRNLLIIKKENDFDSDGYLLNHGKNNNNFMTFEFRYESSESFRLSQTIIIDYDFTQPGMLLVDLTKIKWEK